MNQKYNRGNKKTSVSAVTKKANKIVFQNYYINLLYRLYKKGYQAWAFRTGFELEISRIYRKYLQFKKSYNFSFELEIICRKYIEQNFEEKYL